MVLPIFENNFMTAFNLLMATAEKSLALAGSYSLAHLRSRMT